MWPSSTLPPSFSPFFSCTLFCDNRIKHTSKDAPFSGGPGHVIHFVDLNTCAVPIRLMQPTFCTGRIVVPVIIAINNVFILCYLTDSALIMACCWYCPCWNLKMCIHTILMPKKHGLEIIRHSLQKVLICLFPFALGISCLYSISIHPPESVCTNCFIQFETIMCYESA